MKKNSDKLSGIQLTALTMLSIIGSTSIRLPRMVVAEAGLNGIWVIIVAGIAVLLLTMVYVMLCKRFPHQTILDFSKELVGTIFAKIINLFFVIYFIAFSAFVPRFFADALKVFLLENTPIEVILFSLLIVVVYLVSNGINPVARICESFFIIVIIFLAIVQLLSFQNFDITEIYSLWQINIIQIAKAVPMITIAYLGIEVILFAGAFMSEPKKIGRYAFLGIGIPIIIYTILTIECIGVFSVDTLKYQVYPVLELTKAIAFPGAFAERFDIFFAAFWVMVAFTSVIVFYYLAVYNVTRLVGMRNYRPFAYLLLPVVYTIALVPQDVFQVEVMGKVVSYWGGGIIAGIPILLFIIALIRGKGVRKSDAA